MSLGGYWKNFKVCTWKFNGRYVGGSCTKIIRKYVVPSSLYGILRFEGISAIPSKMLRVWRDPKDLFCLPSNKFKVWSNPKNLFCTTSTKYIISDNVSRGKRFIPVMKMKFKIERGNLFYVVPSDKLKSLGGFSKNVV